MSLKTWVWAGLIIGSLIGGYLPTLFGATTFSGWAIAGNVIGGIIGIYFGYKIGQDLEAP